MATALLVVVAAVTVVRLRVVATAVLLKAAATAVLLKAVLPAATVAVPDSVLLLVAAASLLRAVR